MGEKCVILKPDFAASLERYKRSIRFDCLDDAQSEALQLFEDAGRALEPKVMLRECFIDSHTLIDSLPSVVVGSHTFSGKALKMLDEVNRIFVYVATCGDETEHFDLSDSDMLAPYWLDVIKRQSLTVAMRELRSYLRTHYMINSPRSLNPGSGNVDIWPVDQQKTLFDLLGGAGRIGVRLNNSCLMTPNKSLSGFMFSLPRSDWESCAYCERENCPDRRVKFEKTL